MQKLFYFLLLTTLTSCVSLGSKVLYKSEKNIEFTQIGYAQLFYQRELNSIYPNTDSILFNAINQMYSDNLNKNLIFVNEKFNFELPDKTKIIEICEENNLNGIIVPFLKFIKVSRSVYFIPVSKDYYTEVELKLYDKFGNLIINTKHNTEQGNVYSKYPSAKTIISDGGQGAIKKLLKSYNLLKKK